MIVITGATGHYERMVVESLLKKLPASQIGISVRDPEKASELAGMGVRVSQADFSNPSTLVAQLAELFSIPARIVDISDAQTLEWQRVQDRRCPPRLPGHQHE